MPAFFFGILPGAVDLPANLHHGAADCGRDWIPPAPKEQPPRKLSGKRTAVQTKHSGKRIARDPTEGATGAQPGNLSGQGQRGHEVRRKAKLAVPPCVHFRMC